MQDASAAYKAAMKNPLRNRGYIKVRIGIINKEAQKNVSAKDSRNNFAWFSNTEKVFNDWPVEKLYGTSEHDFTHVDGTNYFLPEKKKEIEIYNNGIVTEELSGKVYINFGGKTGFDIKGLTIDFGECYPEKFTIRSDSVLKTYENDKQLFITEDVFEGTSFFIITPIKMTNQYGRLRIHQFSCGIYNSFTNKEVKNYSFTETMSSITEKIPSMDMNITVDNQNLYYSPDNPDSALAFMEQGQSVEVSFGYDLTGNGDIEWIEPNVAYLKKWSANDVEAKFTATDIYDYEMKEKYKRGLYRENGISLYNLALDVILDAGITDERDYFIDPYLKKVIVYNPMPVVKHSEALQIIANAGRCSLITTRKTKIQIKASFVPDSIVTVNNKTDYSNIKNLLKNRKKEAYAVSSQGFSMVDGTMKFITENPKKYLENGYVSESIYHSSEEGAMGARMAFRLGNIHSLEEYEYGYWEGEVPEITVDFEASWVAFGIIIKFRSVAPLEFHIITYKENIKIQDVTIKKPELNYVSHDTFKEFDRMVFRFTKGPRNSRVFIDNILIGDITDYTISRWNDMYGTPTATRQEKIKEISITKSVYKKSAEEIKDLKTEEIFLKKGTTIQTIEFSKASYGFTASIEENDNVSLEIIDNSNYYVTLRFNAIKDSTTKYVIKGYEYIVDEQSFSVPHGKSGEVKIWKNPLISTTEQAKDLEEWISSHFLGDVDYQISWRGDPRVDSGDLFYLELRDRDNALIKAYQNQITFNGAWKSTMKARKTVMKWQ